jgi:ArsR family transcriptional regulator
MTTLLPLLTEDVEACCASVTEGALGVEQSERLARLFKALGDPTRVRLMSLIAAHRDGEACVCDLTEPVGLSQGTVSHHLKQLVDAGLIEREQRGRWSYYRVVDSVLNALASSLTRR